jgi:hypothetical protein
LCGYCKTPQPGLVQLIYRQHKCEGRAQWLKVRSMIGLMGRIGGQQKSAGGNANRRRALHKRITVAKQSRTHSGALSGTAAKPVPLSDRRCVARWCEAAASRRSRTLGDPRGSLTRRARNPANAAIPGPDLLQRHGPLHCRLQLLGEYSQGPAPCLSPYCTSSFGVREARAGYGQALQHPSLRKTRMARRSYLSL